jgi:hypothetical protein
MNISFVLQNVLKSLVEKTAATFGAVLTNSFVSIFIKGENWISWGVILAAETIGGDYAAALATHWIIDSLLLRQSDKKQSKPDDDDNNDKNKKDDLESDATKL